MRLYLTQSKTLFESSIKSDTIKHYLHVAACLSTQANQTDPILDIYGKNSAPMLKVLQEQKRWEDMPKRRETVTSVMISGVW